MVKYGDYYHLTIPSLPVIMFEPISKYKGEKIEKTIEQQQQLNYLYASKSKKTLKDLLLCNLPEGQPKFLTLTYKTSQHNETQAKLDFKNFVKRLRYYQKKYFRYIAVLEQHDSKETETKRRYSYHIHAVVFDMTYLSANIYADIWKNGFIRINRIKGDDLRMTNYISKYLTKADTHKRYQRRFLSSKNCLKPQRVDFQDLPLLEYIVTRQYNRFTGGTCRVEIYKIKK